MTAFSFRYIGTSEEIFFYAHKLLTDEMPLKLRLLGVRMSSFKFYGHCEENSESDCNSSENQQKISTFLRTHKISTQKSHQTTENQDSSDEDWLDLSDSHDISLVHNFATSNNNNDNQRDASDDDVDTTEGLSPSVIYKRLNKKIKEQILDQSQNTTNDRTKRKFVDLTQIESTKKKQKHLDGQQQTLDFFFQRNRIDLKNM